MVCFQFWQTKISNFEIYFKIPISLLRFCFCGVRYICPGKYINMCLNQKMTTWRFSIDPVNDEKWSSTVDHDRTMSQFVASNLFSFIFFTVKKANKNTRDEIVKKNVKKCRVGTPLMNKKNNIIVSKKSALRRDSTKTWVVKKFIIDNVAKQKIHFFSVWPSTIGVRRKKRTSNIFIIISLGRTGGRFVMASQDMPCVPETWIPQGAINSLPSKEQRIFLSGFLSKIFPKKY